MALVSNTPVISTQINSFDLMRAKADAEVAMMRAKHDAELEMARLWSEQVAADIQSVAQDPANSRFHDLRQEIATIIRQGDKCGDTRPTKVRVQEAYDQAAMSDWLRNEPMVAVRYSPNVETGFSSSVDRRSSLNETDLMRVVIALQEEVTALRAERAPKPLPQPPRDMEYHNNLIDRMHEFINEGRVARGEPKLVG